MRVIAKKTKKLTLTHRTGAQEGKRDRTKTTRGTVLLKSLECPIGSDFESLDHQALALGLRNETEPQRPEERAESRRVSRKESGRSTVMNLQ